MKGRHAASFDARVSTRARVLLSLISSAVAILAVLPAPQAFAAQPTCGVPITASVKLTADLDCTGGGSGIVVGISGVTIDLNGFKVTGINGTGILVGSAKRVKVLNGVVEGFTTQVAVTSSSSVTVDNLLLRATRLYTSGVVVSDSAGVTVNNVVAIDVDGSNGAVGFSFSSNIGKVALTNSFGRGFGYGVLATGSSFATELSNNVITDSLYAGIEYVDNPGSLVASGNVTLDTEQSGIAITCRESNVVEGGPVTLTGNKTVRAGGGFSGTLVTNCELGKSTFTGNASVESGGAGFLVADVPNSTWSDNRAAENGGPGFLFNALLTGVTVTGNRADLNAANGFFFESGTAASVTGNFARGNGMKGFLSSNDATTVSSGNIAFGNNDGSDAQQCDSVSCVLHRTVSTFANCGDQVRSSIVLDRDLDCSGQGGASALIIPGGTSRVTIDLNGYTITAKDNAIELADPGAAKNITIKNGVLAGGTYGVYVATGGSTVTMENVFSTSSTPESKTYWADLGFNAGGTVTANDVVSDRTSWALEAPTVIANGVLAGLNGLGPVAEVLQADRLITLSRANGVFVDATGQTAASVVTNSLIDAQYPLHIFCDLFQGGGPSVKGNVVVGGVATAETPNGNGIQVSQCSGGAVADNVALKAGLGFQLINADGMTVSGNRAYQNTTVGFDIYFNLATAVFKGNFADYNAEDGFYFYNPGTPRTFSSNFARGNGFGQVRGDGFTAPGPVPGSGNVAFGNFTGDCYNVTCKFPA